MENMNSRAAGVEAQSIRAHALAIAAGLTGVGPKPSDLIKAAKEIEAYLKGEAAPNAD